MRWRSWRDADDVESAPFATFALHVDDVLTSRPWRETLAYRSRKPQFSGWFAPSKPSQIGEQLHFESRLERSALIEGDRDRTVALQRPQPFQIAVRVNGRVRVHTPDLLRVMTAGTLALVDVKPAAKAATEKAQIAHSIAFSLCRAMGWTLLDFSGEPLLRRVNLGWLAGYRRVSSVDPLALAAARALVHERWPRDRTVTLGQALASSTTGRRPYLRSALMHLLWTGELGVDLDQPLTIQSVIYPALPPLPAQPQQHQPDPMGASGGNVTERAPGGAFASGHYGASR